jgi:hypothetical protein
MDLGENPTLAETVETDTEMKEWLVNYVGNKATPESGDVTVEMIINEMSKEFPEFLMAIAEENWIRGYHQALEDVSVGHQEYERELAKKAVEDGTDDDDSHN